MQIKVKDTEYEIKGTTARPSRISFQINGLEYMFDLKLSRDGSIYISNSHHIHKKRKGPIDWSDDSVNLMLNPYLELKPTDFPFYKEVFAHWSEIRPAFVACVAHGSWLTGHTSTSYTFPDGRGERYPAKGIPADLRPRRGMPFDDRFTSDGCKYIAGHPFEQHYRHGRHDYYLEKDSINTEDEKTIQEMDRRQAEAVLEFIELIEHSPQDAIESLATIGPPRKV